MSLGIDLHNHCCVNQTDYPADPWKGSDPREPGKPGELARFIDPAFSYRAALRNYQMSILKGKVMLSEIVATYAPTSDGNDPEDYTRILLKRLFGDGTHQVDLNVKDYLIHSSRKTINRSEAHILLWDIARIESGPEYKELEVSQSIEYGIFLHNRDHAAQWR